MRLWPLRLSIRREVVDGSGSRVWFVERWWSERGGVELSGSVCAPTLGKAWSMRPQRGTTAEPSIPISVIERIQVEEGDTLVFRTPQKLTFDEVNRIKTNVEGIWPDNRVVVLEDGASLDVLLPPPGGGFAGKLRVPKRVFEESVPDETRVEEGYVAPEHQMGPPVF